VDDQTTTSPVGLYRFNLSSDSSRNGNDTTIAAVVGLIVGIIAICGIVSLLQYVLELTCKGGRCYYKYKKKKEQDEGYY
jgi:hypothetical protein